MDARATLLFLEVVVDYFRWWKNMDGTELFSRCTSPFALLNPSIPNRLARRVFELNPWSLTGKYTGGTAAAYFESWRLCLGICGVFPGGIPHKFILKDDDEEFESVVEGQQALLCAL